MLQSQLFAAAPHLTAGWRRWYVQRLTKWFSQHCRDLPWRRTDDPYAIWLSESMLQQTQVATVIDYYHRFLERFPDVRSLAEADESAVLKQWAGLGYYRRARQLHAAARQVVEAHGGSFPDDVSQLMSLPGIGRYTAGAVVSIAFDKPAPIVEANTERLFARLLCLRQPPRSPAGQSLLWEFASWQLPRGSAGGARVINQAAMELGSLVCKPLRPLCDQCPLSSQCPTALQGLQSSIPLPKPKKQFTPLHHIALLIARGDRWLVRINPPGSWWTGLWDFPRVDVTPLDLCFRIRSNAALAQEACAAVEATAEEQLGLRTRVHSPLFRLTHGVTRYRIQVDCIEAQGAQFAASPAPIDNKNGDGNCKHMPTPAPEQGRLDDVAPDGWVWASQAEMERLPMTSPARKMLSRLPRTPS